MQGCSPLDVLSDILMDVPDIVFAYTHDGRYLFINTAAAEFLGANPIDVIGCHWRDLGYPAEVMEPLTQSVGSVAATGRPAYHRFRTSPMRGSRMLDMSLTPLWSEEGNVLAVLAIAHDISEFFPPDIDRLD
jgi:PAS domain S-box-containing protein